MKKIVITLSLMIVSLNAMSQLSLNTLLKSVEMNNPKIASGAAKLLEDGLAARMGRNPVNPELEYSKIFGTESDSELTLKQQFDFPTLYRQRNNISKIGVEKAELEFDALRRDVLSEVSEIYVEAVGAARRIAILNVRVQNSDKIDLMFQKKFDTGEATILERNRAKVMSVNMRSELLIAKTEYQNLLNKLTTLNGGKQVEIVVDSYPDFSSVEQALDVDRVVNNSYAIRSVVLDSLSANAQIKLAKQEWIPSFSLGYKALIGGSKVRSGVVAGISIPLWQNRGNVKYAKSIKNYAAANYFEQASNMRSELNNLILSCRSFQEVSDSYKSYLSSNNDMSLLLVSLEKGAITMTDYLVELSVLYDTVDLANSALLSLYKTKAQMTRFLNAPSKKM